MTTLSLVETTTSDVGITPHTEYRNKYPIWTLMNDAYSTDIRRFAHKYISPPPGSFQSEFNKVEEVEETVRQLIIPVAEGSGWNAAAKAYALGGYEADLVPRTVKGFISLVSQHDPVIELPASISYLEDAATSDKKSLSELYLRAVRKVLLKGRVPILLDITGNNINYVMYEAEALLDWEALDTSSDSSLFRYAIFQDVVDNPEFDPLSKSEPRFIDVFHYHHLDSGVYKVKTLAKDEKYKSTIDKTVVPSLFGETLDYIPLVALGSIDNTPDVDAVPLIGIANCTLSIYDLSCMLKHAEKTSAVPTMYMTGVDKDDVPSVTGAGVCISLADYQARVGYTTTDTSAMTHIESRMESYYSQAQELGASLLGSTKHGTESGEALRLRQASSTATLSSIAESVGKGFLKLLTFAAAWRKTSDESIKFEPNKEFSTFALTANETVALVQTWQGGAMAHSTLLENFRKAGMLKAGETVEDEQENLKKPGEKYVEPEVKSSKNELDIAQNLPKSNTFNKNL